MHTEAMRTAGTTTIPEPAGPVATLTPDPERDVPSAGTKPRPILPAAGEPAEHAVLVCVGTLPPRRGRIAALRG